MNIKMICISNGYSTVSLGLLVVLGQYFPGLGLHETFWEFLVAITGDFSHFGPRDKLKVFFNLFIVVSHFLSFPVVGSDFEFEDF